jgi:hypothetical protein
MSRPGVPMSWPAEKCGPAPVKTMQPMASSSMACWKARSSAKVISAFWALRKRGRFIVTTATGPRVS